MTATVAKPRCLSPRASSSSTDGRPLISGAMHAIHKATHTPYDPFMHPRPIKPAAQANTEPAFIVGGQRGDGRVLAMQRQGSRQVFFDLTVPRLVPDANWEHPGEGALLPRPAGVDYQEWSRRPVV